MSAAVCIEALQVWLQTPSVQQRLLALSQLRIEPGEQVAIVGPNGAGKSSLLKLLGGQLTAQAGIQVQARRLDVLGHQLAGDAAAAAGTDTRRRLRQDTGLLMQGLHLVPRLSAIDNVLIGALARLRGAAGWRSLLRCYPPALQAEAEAALAALGLADRAGTRADRLSGGERQKVALARLQLQQPRLLLADEPTSALDPAATTQVCQALRALASSPGRTLVTVLHDLELLPLLAQRVIGMAAGQLQWDLPIQAVTPERLQALYAQPPQPSVSMTPNIAPRALYRETPRTALPKH